LVETDISIVETLPLQVQGNLFQQASMKRMIVKYLIKLKEKKKKKE